MQVEEGTPDKKRSWESTRQQVGQGSGAAHCHGSREGGTVAARGQLSHAGFSEEGTGSPGLNPVCRCGLDAQTRCSKEGGREGTTVGEIL